MGVYGIALGVSKPREKGRAVLVVFRATIPVVSGMDVPLDRATETETKRFPAEFVMGTAPVMVEKVIGASIMIAEGRRSEGDVTSSGR